MDRGPYQAQVPLFLGVDALGGRVLGGLDLETLLSRSLIEQGATHVTPSQHLLLMLNSIDMTDDEAHALGAGRLRQGFASLGLRTMLSTESLGPALEVLNKYFATCSSVFRLAITKDGDLAKISFRAEGRGEARCEILEETWFSALYIFMCWFVGRRIPVAAATVARLGHPDAQKMHWAGNAPLMRGDVSSFYMPLACLEWRRDVIHFEEPIWEAWQFWLNEDEADVDQARTGLRMVFGKLDAPAKARSREVYAGRIVGDRQLSRRMKSEHGASFRDLRGDALVEVAKTMLRTTDAPIEVIGAQLGYAEERSFRRFVRNRTGLTPTQLRRSASRSPATADEAVRSRIHALTRKMDR